MKCTLNGQVVVAQIHAGPLQGHVNAFAQFLDAQGYSLISIRRYSLVASDFNRWLHAQGIELCDIGMGHSRTYLKKCVQQGQSYFQFPAALDQLYRFLHGQKLIPDELTEVPVLCPVDTCLLDYEQYLSKDRGLARGTIKNHLWPVRCFLSSKFGPGPMDLSQLTGDDIARFVQRKTATWGTNSMRNVTSALRCFLRFARYRQLLQSDLAVAVPVVANWSLTHIPKAISQQQVDQLLSSIDRATPAGLRDYAIVLLLARLGLRSCEVAFLELDDLDWNTGAMSVRCKGNTRSVFPLDDEVGQAIAAYLRDGRPQCQSRRVFLRAQAPWVGFKVAGAVSLIVRRLLARSGVSAPTTGAHQFRHGLACEMLRQNASLGEIGEVLGHRLPQTTMIYTKVDFAALRSLALQWPGSER